MHLGARQRSGVLGRGLSGSSAPLAAAMLGWSMAEMRYQQDHQSALVRAWPRQGRLRHVCSYLA